MRSETMTQSMGCNFPSYASPACCVAYSLCHTGQDTSYYQSKSKSSFLSIPNAFASTTTVDIEVFNFPVSILAIELKAIVHDSQGFVASYHSFFTHTQPSVDDA